MRAFFVTGSSRRKSARLICDVRENGMGYSLTAMMLCKSGFFVCAVPCSGSFLLCDLLRSTGVAGNPMEYGVQDDERTWRHIHGFNDHAADLKRYKTIDAGGMIDTIDLAFGEPRYVQLLRKDKERQTISLVRANQAGIWSSAQRPSAQPLYDPALLERAGDFLLGQEDAWNDALRGLDQSRRMTLYYEDVVENMEATVTSVLSWLQIADSPRPFKPPSMKRQSDAITQEWLDRWRKHKVPG